MLAVLTLLATILAWSFLVKPGERAGNAVEKLFPGLDRHEIHRLALDLPEGDVTLARVGDAWILPERQGYPANPVYVKALLDALERAPRGTVVAQNPKDLSRYGLADNARQVAMYGKAGDSRGSIWVGKATDNYRAVYTRSPHEAAVRLTVADLYPCLNRPFWADRAVWRIPPQLMREIRLEDRSSRFHAIRDDSGDWRLAAPEGGVLSERFAAEALPSIAYLQAGDVQFPKDPQTAFEASGSLTARAAQATLRLEWTALDEDVLLARRPDSPAVYVILKRRFDSLLASVEPSP